MDIHKGNNKPIIANYELFVKFTVSPFYSQYTIFRTILRITLTKLLLHTSV